MKVTITFDKWLLAIHCSFSKRSSLDTGNDLQTHVIYFSLHHPADTQLLSDDQFLTSQSRYATENEAKE